jgi:hypothetical protein
VICGFSTGIRSDSVFGSYVCRLTCSMRLRRELLSCRFYKDLAARGEQDGANRLAIIGDYQSRMRQVVVRRLSES